MLKQIVMLSLILTSSAFAKERERCPFNTDQQKTASQDVEQKIEGYIEARNVALGLMLDDKGQTLGPVISKDMVDKKRVILANLEAWAMTLQDNQLKTDYLCAIMVRRRGLDQADLELIDHGLQNELEGKNKQNAHK